MSIKTNKLIINNAASGTTPYVDAISTSLSSASTDQQLPTAKSVFTLSKWKGGNLYDDGFSLFPTIVTKVETDIVRLPALIFGVSGTHLINGTVTTVNASSSDSKIPTAKAVRTAITNATTGLASETYVNNAITAATQDLVTNSITTTTLVTDSININGTALATKVIEIGPLNMPVTGYIYIPHGLDNTKVRDISCMIMNDSGISAKFINTYENYGVSEANLLEVQTTDILLQWDDASLYSKVGPGAQYVETTSNRGWITITYEV